MGIRDYTERAEQKNVVLDLELAKLSDINYWVRTLKYRFKKDKVLKVELKINVFYLSEDREERE